MVRSSKLPALALTFVWAVLGPASTLLGARSSLAADEDVLQALADATVIDEDCRTTNTMYGAVFAYGEAHGIRTIDVLLLGKRRREFEAAMERRLGAMTREDICGALQAGYLERFPGWFRAR